MSGVYGTIRPANVNIEMDVEMFYHYRPTRGTEDGDFSEFKPLDSSCLVHSTAEGVGTLFGMYNLNLPLDKFSRKGIYTIYIRPKETVVPLQDVGTLLGAGDDSIRGIVISTSALGGISDLTGYRVEYYKNGESGDKSDTTRLITSCNRCEPRVITGLGNGNVRYTLTDSSSNLLFCTLTPSAAASYKSYVTPYIGRPMENVVITNTKFSPVMLEIEMVEHNEDTISYMLEGSSVRDRDNAIITTYNDDNEIYHQADYYTIKSKLGAPLFDVKEKRVYIDNSQDYDNVINNAGNA